MQSLTEPYPANTGDDPYIAESAVSRFLGGGLSRFFYTIDNLLSSG